MAGGFLSDRDRGPQGLGGVQAVPIIMRDAAVLYDVPEQVLRCGKCSGELDVSTARPTDVDLFLTEHQKCGRDFPWPIDLRII